MFPDELFHPDHIVPSFKFISAVIEFSYKPVSLMTMELYAVSVKVFIFFLRAGYTGVHIKKAIFP